MDKIKKSKRDSSLQRITCLHICIKCPNNQTSIIVIQSILFLHNWCQFKMQWCLFSHKKECSYQGWKFGSSLTLPVSLRSTKIQEVYLFYDPQGGKAKKSCLSICFPFSPCLNPPLSKKGYHFSIWYKDFFLNKFFWFEQFFICLPPMGGRKLVSAPKYQKTETTSL